MLIVAITILSVVSPLIVLALTLCHAAGLADKKIDEIFKKEEKDGNKIL